MQIYCLCVKCQAKKKTKKKTTFWKISKSQWWGWYTLTRSKMDLINYGVLILRITTNKSDKVHITKTRLFKYIENFTTKKGKFSDKKKYFWYFCSKQRLWVLVRTTSVRRSKRVPIIYGFFFQQNKKNNLFPCKLQFYCIKDGFKGVKII